jgi:Holliday junction resolvase RusA-like endonuclease
MKEYRFTVQGNPAPWTVWVRKSAPHRGFLEMQRWQEQIMLELRHQWGNKPPIAWPVEVDTDFYLPWPKTAPTRSLEAMRRWHNKHLVMKPDLDNLRKACIDATASVLFAVGDQQVVKGTMLKTFLPFGRRAGRTEIVVKVWDDG